MHRFSMCGIAMSLVLSACLMACDPPTPISTSAPPSESAVTYIGQLVTARPGSSSTAQGGQDMIALIVTATQIRAAVCSSDPVRWRTVDTWMAQGTINAAQGISAQSDAHTGLTAFLQADAIAGIYTASDGTKYAFTAHRKVDQSQIEQGDQEGVYRLDRDNLAGTTGHTVLVAIVNALPLDVCSFLLAADNTPLSRVALKSTWQAGVSIFILSDLHDQDNNAPLISMPGQMQHITAIQLH